jgi:Predicted transcriptional regulators
MDNKDINLDGILDDDIAKKAVAYADQLGAQLKKGLLSYCMLLACKKSVYTSEIIDKLRVANLDVVEGTIYPILSRMQKDGLLSHSWKESPHGPPRKYYQITEYGQKTEQELMVSIEKINQAVRSLEEKDK